MREASGQSLKSRFEPTTAGVLICFLLSGFAALLYETVWMRQFAIVFGTSELAVAAVLATYMAGLALGASIIGRYVNKIRRPILVYGLLEIGIAVTALAVPWGLRAARWLLVALIGGQDAPPSGTTFGLTMYYLAATFVVVVIPTAFMGATLPLLTRYAVHNRDQVGSRTGLLYAVNTAGAVAGTLVAAFLLLPNLGLAGTVYFGIGVNALVFLLAMWIVRLNGSTVDAHSTAATTETPLADSMRVWKLPILTATSPILPIMLVSGLVSFTYEVLWTRLLGHLLGGSVYAFATMLAGFLSGITIGSAVASRIAKSREYAVRGFIAAQLGTAIMAMLDYLALDYLPGLSASFSAGSIASSGSSGISQVVSGAILAFAVLLPATLCIGASFPFAIRILAQDESDAAQASAQVYAWNTVGAISGALLAGFVLIPEIQFAGTTRLAVAMNFSLALGVAVMYGMRRVPVAISAALLVTTLIFFQPPQPENLLRASPFTTALAPGRLIYSAAGKSATVLLLERDGSYDLRNNGLPEARIQPKGVPPANRNSDECLGAMPLMARPNSKSLLVIGFGGGVTVEHAPAAIKNIDVIELEEEVVNANRKVALLRNQDPLSDPRVNVIINDARGALSLTNKRYDIICSQPSHPWTAGASHLFTTEFLAQAREHLNPSGVFVQWMSVGFIDETLLKTLGKTVLNSFRDVRLYSPTPGMVLFLASDETLEPELQVARTGEPLKSDPNHFGRLAINRAEDLCLMLLLDRRGLEEFCGNAAANTDDMNVLAMRTPKALTRPLDDASLVESIAPYDPLTTFDSALFAQSPPLINARKVARRMAFRNESERALRVARAHLSGADLLFIEGETMAAMGRPADARKRYEESITANPNADYARFELLQSWITENAADPRIAEEAKRLTDPGKAIVEHMQDAANARWQAVAADDARIGSGEPGDQYSVYAARLRAGWRVYLSDPALQKTRAREAIDIIDKSLAYGADGINLTMRFHAAVLLSEPDLEVETAGTLAALFNQMLSDSGGKMTTATRQVIRYSVPAVLPDLQRLANHPRVSRRRVEEVAKVLSALYQRAMQ